MKTIIRVSCIAGIILLVHSCRRDCNCDCAGYMDSVMKANAQRSPQGGQPDQAGAGGAGTPATGQSANTRSMPDGKSPLDTTKNDPGGNMGAYPNNKPEDFRNKNKDVGSGNLNNIGTQGGTQGATGSTAPTGTKPK